jgi:hypothetical protein
METLDVIAGLAWDPEIRGFLAVLTGAGVLMGSVWLIVSTNTGVRLGSLIALAGFFGWMFIMAVIWWIYGIGYKGDSPSWELEEINVGDLGAAALPEARELPNHDDLPTAYGIVMASDDVVAQAEFGEVTRDTLTADQTEGLSDEEIDALVAEEQARNEDTTLSELAAVSPDLIDEEEESGELDFGGWILLSTAEAGEAQASALAFLTASPDIDFEAGDFKVLDSYTIGGKPGLPDDPDRLDRIWTQIRSAFRITHPTRYGIVQVREATEESLTLTPGQPPPRIEADPNKAVISVIMIRDLGNERLKPALVALGSFAIFGALCLVMHERDKTMTERRAEFEAGR